MAGQSFAQLLSDGRLLVSGIRKNGTSLEKRGVTSERAVEIEEMLNEVESLDNEQESLKARLKSTTEELNQKTTALKAALATETHIVKAVIPQELWREFGIEAKH